MLVPDLRCAEDSLADEDMYEEDEQHAWASDGDDDTAEAQASRAADTDGVPRAPPSAQELARRRALGAQVEQHSTAAAFSAATAIAAATTYQPLSEPSHTRNQPPTLDAVHPHCWCCQLMSYIPVPSCIYQSCIYQSWW